MLRVLLKKQLLETSMRFFQRGDGKNTRSAAGRVGYIVLYVALFGVLTAMFAIMAVGLCLALGGAGLSELYFAIIGVLAVAMGIFGSVFSTYNTLYQAKDTELLLSLPIPNRDIVLSRLFTVAIWSAAYSSMVLVPSIVVYWVLISASLGAVVCGILLIPTITAFVLALSCLLGWVVAKISARLKHKSVMTVIFSLAFLTLYYIVYFQSGELLESVLVGADQANEALRRVLPLYWLGRAGTGDVLSLLLLMTSIAVVCAAVLWLMSRSFLPLASVGTVTAKRERRVLTMRAHTSDRALLRRELLRLGSSATYMLNCAMGTLFLPILGVVALINAPRLGDIMAQLALTQDVTALVACGVLCLCATMNDLTSAAVSLEGNTLWIVQGLPVSGRQVLHAKWSMHLVVTLPPLWICVVCLAVALRLPLLLALALLILSTLFVLLHAAFGLWMNLLLPNLSWTSEVVPVKQGMSVFFGLFGGWVFLGALTGACIVATLLSVPAWGCLVGCGVLMLALFLALNAWLNGRGGRRFERLSQ